MLQFDYCPPFSVFNGTAPGVRPVLETQSLPEALESLRTRPHGTLTVSVLVTGGDTSTLVPVTLVSRDLDGKLEGEVRSFIESRAENRFRSMFVDAAAAG